MTAGSKLPERPKPVRLGWWRTNATTAFFFLLPSLAGFLIFTVLPILAALVLSFYRWDLISQPEFIGISNYRQLLTADPLFYRVLWNTTYYVLGVVPASIVIGLSLALILNQDLRARALFRAAYFLPVITSLVAASLVWKWIFSPDAGLMNEFLMFLGVANPPRWVVSTQWAMPAVIIVSIWKSVGFNMVIFLAGLQDIAKELYEAAEIDGANRWHLLWYITIPSLRPTTFFITVISIINSFQVFTLALVMTEGGPGLATNTLVLYIYQNAFQFFNMGYAAAVAWVLFLIILIFTLLQMYYVRRRGAGA